MSIIQWSPGMTLAAIERLVIEAAYRHYNCNKTHTANALGVSARTIHEKVDKFNLDNKHEEDAAEKRRIEREEWLARSRGRNNPGQNPHDQIIEYAERDRKAADGKISASVEVTVGGKPSLDHSGQSDMPVPKRQEVQKMLPHEVARSSDQRKRG
jgi:hypothetical protein